MEDATSSRLWRGLLVAAIVLTLLLPVFLIGGFVAFVLLFGY